MYPIRTPSKRLKVRPKRDFQNLAKQGKHCTAPCCQVKRGLKALQTIRRKTIVSKSLWRNGQPVVCMQPLDNDVLETLSDHGCVTMSRISKSDFASMKRNLFVRNCKAQLPQSGVRRVGKRLFENGVADSTNVLNNGFQLKEVRVVLHDVLQDPEIASQNGITPGTFSRRLLRSSGPSSEGCTLLPKRLSKARRSRGKKAVISKKKKWGKVDESLSSLVQDWRIQKNENNEYVILVSDDSESEDCLLREPSSLEAKKKSPPNTRATSVTNVKSRSRRKQQLVFEEVGKPVVVEERRQKMLPSRKSSRYPRPGHHRVVTRKTDDGNDRGKAVARAKTAGKKKIPNPLNFSWQQDAESDFDSRRRSRRLVAGGSVDAIATSTPVQRKRGLPGKRVHRETPAADAYPVAKRKRGRPRKVKEEQDAGALGDDEATIASLKDASLLLFSNLKKNLGNVSGLFSSDSEAMKIVPKFDFVNLCDSSGDSSDSSSDELYEVLMDIEGSREHFMPKWLNDLDNKSNSSLENSHVSNDHEKCTLKVQLGLGVEGGVQTDSGHELNPDDLLGHTPEDDFLGHSFPVLPIVKHEESSCEETNSENDVTSQPDVSEAQNDERGFSSVERNVQDDEEAVEENDKVAVKQVDEGAVEQYGKEAVEQDGEEVVEPDKEPVEQDDEEVVEQNEEAVERDKESVVEQDEEVVEQNEEAVEQDDERVVEQNEVAVERDKESVVEQDEEVVEQCDGEVVEQDDREAMEQEDEEDVAQDEEVVDQDGEEAVEQDDEVAFEQDQEFLEQDDEKAVEQDDREVVEQDEEVVVQDEEELVEQDDEEAVEQDTEVVEQDDEEFVEQVVEETVEQVDEETMEQSPSFSSLESSCNDQESPDIQGGSNSESENGAVSENESIKDVTSPELSSPVPDEEYTPHGSPSNASLILSSPSTTASAGLENSSENNEIPCNQDSADLQPTLNSSHDGGCPQSEEAISESESHLLEEYLTSPKRTSPVSREENSPHEYSINSSVNSNSLSTPSNCAGVVNSCLDEEITYDDELERVTHSFNTYTPKKITFVEPLSSPLKPIPGHPSKKCNDLVIDENDDVPLNPTPSSTDEDEPERLADETVTTEGGIIYISTDDEIKSPPVHTSQPWKPKKTSKKRPSGGFIRRKLMDELKKKDRVKYDDSPEQHAVVDLEVEVDGSQSFAYPVNQPPEPTTVVSDQVSTEPISYSTDVAQTVPVGDYFENGNPSANVPPDCSYSGGEMRSSDLPHPVDETNSVIVCNPGPPLGAVNAISVASHGDGVNGQILTGYSQNDGGTQLSENSAFTVPQQQDLAVADGYFSHCMAPVDNYPSVSPQAANNQDLNVAGFAPEPPSTSYPCADSVDVTPRYVPATYGPSYNANPPIQSVEFNHSFLVSHQETIPQGSVSNVGYHDPSSGTLYLLVMPPSDQVPQYQ